jgi:hypothetical protein
MRLLYFIPLLVAFANVATSLTCLAQNLSYDVIILADGKPINIGNGISVTTKTLHITGQLTSQSKQQYPNLMPTVAINRATLNLIRDTNRISFTDWPYGDSITTLFKEAKVGDRFVIKLEDVKASTKSGTMQTIEDTKIVQLTLRQ